ncbi:MAG: bifunctional DNA-formamidopyrimidine glycosylase/DNA-(apurinic or apyrimidinic site) lyase [Clostridiales bacterium]
MPELPEIETVKKTLTPLLQGKTITDCRLVRGEVIKHPLPDVFAERIIGRRVRDLGRRGKYLLLHMTDGSLLVAHLRMTGRLLCTAADYPQKPHTHVILPLDDSRELRFADTRRFGCLWLIEAGENDDFTGMAKLGIEPLSQQLTAEYLQSALGKRRITIKQGILDQSVVAGLGNIYADETLFAAALCPYRSVQSLREQDWQKLVEVIPLVLRSAIANNGTTFSDYVDGEGKEGRNLPFLQAYGRKGQACGRCGQTMIRVMVGGRGSCYCPNCQK